MWAGKGVNILDVYIVDASSLPLQARIDLFDALDGVMQTYPLQPRPVTARVYTPDGKTPADLFPLPAGVTFRKGFE